MMISLKAKRKYQLKDFSDLFQALFKIKDKDVQNRVLDAINGITTTNLEIPCQFCSKQQKNGISITSPTTTTREIGVQTENLYMPDDKQITTNDLQSFARKRKRVSMIPKVEKSRPDKIRCLELKSLANTKIQKYDEDKSFKAVEHFLEPLITNEQMLDKYLPGESTTILTQETVVEKMLVEFQNCNIFNSDGYLPIHKAIIDNDLKWLKRQIYVLKYRKIELHKLVTNTEHLDNPFQLAIKHNCFPVILKELINFDRSYLFDKVIDKDQNTLVHLGMYYLDIDTFDVLMDNINRLDILLNLNGEGLTALHIGVNLNKPLMCQSLISIIDKKLGIITQLPTSLKTEIDMKFFYENSINTICNQKLVKSHSFKQKILNAKDMKHGKTSLLFSLADNSCATISTMLLYNLADPRIKDYAEKDALEILDDNSKMQHIVLRVIDYLNEN